MKWKELIETLNNFEHKYLKTGEVEKITIAKEDTMYCIQICSGGKIPPLYIFKKIDDTEIIDFEEEK